MFIKLSAKFELSGEPAAPYTVTVISRIDQVCQSYDGKVMCEVKEDILEVHEDEIIQVLLKSDLDEAELSIPVQSIGSQDDWVLVKPLDDTAGYIFTLEAVKLERAPVNWFDKTLDLLQAERPWFFKAEDLYNLSKHILKEHNISNSRPVAELCKVVDYAAVLVAQNLLSVSVEEGFSLLSCLDDLLDHLLASTDSRFDNFRVKLALSLQRLRRAVTKRLKNLSSLTEEKLAELRFRAGIAKEKYGSGLHSAYHWAQDRSEKTTQWLRTEQKTILDRVYNIKECSQAAVVETQATLLSAPSKVYARVSQDLSHRIETAQDTIMAIPVKAHPYVHGCVEASQPYVHTAIATATPYIQTIRDKTPVDRWVVETQKAIEKDERVSSVVEAVTERALKVLDTVFSYCLDEKFYDHQQEEVNETDTTMEIKEEPTIEHIEEEQREMFDCMEDAPECVMGEVY